MESLRRNSSVPIQLSVLLMVLGFTTRMATGHEVTAMFVFGDSLADAGNNNYLPNELAHTDIEPYGISYFPKPTGRWTDGRTIFDFIATMLGFPFIPPYLEPNANFSRGINFASGGSGYLDQTASEAMILTMSYQISHFENYSELLINEIGAEKAASYLSKSLYAISAGSNDIFFNYMDPAFNVPSLINKTEEFVTRLYRAGARKIFVLDIPAIGCLPNSRLTEGNLTGGCFDYLNSLAEEYNTLLKPLVCKLNEMLEGAAIIHFYSYDYYMNVIENGETYGFSETKSACCGSGKFNAEVLCGRGDPICFCKHPDEYIFWDSFHPTEKLNHIIYEEIWGGNSSIIEPFNLSTLISWDAQAEGNTCNSNSTAHLQEKSNLCPDCSVSTLI